MSKNKRKQPTRTASPPVTQKVNAPLVSQPLPLVFVLGVCAITAIAFFPILDNGFTNWDDQLYVLENPLLRGPDWAGIFSKPVVSNYHPLTVASLAFNYQLSALSPFSYHLVNWILHVLNTGLVFYLAFRLSEGNRYVGFITALLFGVHPMHVESVAWVSERKDVLYTFFFLSSLLFYLRYVQQQDWKKYVGAMVLFALSLLSKPAAVTLPVVLLLLDWFKGRSLINKKVWLEKLPFFALALIFGLLTLQFQAEKAIAQQDYYPIWQRMVFACYGFGEYIIRLFWPSPLSAIHPFPNAGVVPSYFYPALFITAVTAIAGWYFRKNKNILFGLGFYVINVALVLQFLAFGNAIISERYTYVPYFGLVFALAMTWANSKWSASIKNGLLGLFMIAGLGFAVFSNSQVRVWKDSQTLWTNAIAAYPNSHVARSNRGYDLITRFKKYDEGLVDYNIALHTDPDHDNSLENRTIIYLHKQNYEAAFADAEQFVRFHPNKPRSYFLRAFTAIKLNSTDQALADYAKCIALDPQNEEPRGNRGIIYFNSKQDYRAAKDDFDTAIRLNPKKGVNYLNRARCWIKFANKAEALRDIEMAKQLGEKVEDAFVQSAQSLQ
jgi:protein O-mannosyl-transferase